MRARQLLLGQHAVVIDAGIAVLASALRGHFERVTVLELDEFSPIPNAPKRYAARSLVDACETSSFSVASSARCQQVGLVPAGSPPARR